MTSAITAGRETHTFAVEVDVAVQPGSVPVAADVAATLNDKARGMIVQHGRSTLRPFQTLVAVRPAAPALALPEWMAEHHANGGSQDGDWELKALAWLRGALEARP